MEELKQKITRDEHEGDETMLLARSLTIPCAALIASLTFLLAAVLGVPR